MKAKERIPITPEFFAEKSEASIYSYNYCNDINDKIYYSTGDDDLKRDMLQHRSTSEANANLAGDIDKEFSIEDKSLIERLHKMLCKHVSIFTNQKTIKINTTHPEANTPPWINYMRPNEFNPQHAHSGLFSFVWYLDIPEEIREEWKKVRSNRGRRGCIEFYSSLLPTYKMTFNPKTNDFFLFNSHHNHQVYPYYSDNTRISLAGNIYEAYYEQ